MPAEPAPTLTLQLPGPAGGRLPQIDELKGLAILLVVLYHAGGVLTWQNLLHGDLGVDMFVILSGVGLALGNAPTGAMDFLRRRFLRILPGYWVVLTAYWVLNSQILQIRATAFELVVHYLGIHALLGDPYAMGINDSFWFVTLILGLYALYAALRAWLADPGRLLLAGSLISVGVSLAFFFTEQSGTFRHLGLRLPGFFLGLLAGQLLRAGRLDLPLTSRLALGLFIVSYVPYTLGVMFHTTVMGALLMLFYVFTVRPALPPTAARRVGSCLTFFGRYSLEIFLIHQPLIRDYVYYCLGRFFGIVTPTPAQLIGAMAAGFILTVFLSIELQRLLARLQPKRQSSGTA